MVKKLMLAIAVVALAAPAFAAVQNVKVGGSIVTTSIIRDNFDIATNTTPGRQNEILAQTRLAVNADLTDNVSTAVGLLNENLWGNSSNTVSLEYANVTMKEFMYAPLSVTIGRQTLAYGNQLIIGNSSTGAYDNQYSDLAYSTGFDGIKAVLKYDPLTIDLFAVRVANASTTASNINGTHDNTNLFGVNANYKLGDKMSTVVEGYVFAVTQDGTISGLSQAVYVPGLRVSTNPIEGLNVQIEAAYQGGRINNTVSGSNVNDDRNAFAFQGMVNYALPVLKDMKPVLGLEYTYLSGTGTGDRSNGKNWNTMFENQNSGRIYDAIVTSNTSVQRAGLSAEVSPIKDLTTKASVTGLWDATKAAANTSKYRGAEADLDATYAYTEDVKFGVSAGYFFSGKAYAPGTKDASQLLSSVSVAF